jgi:hypothetical protein
MCICVELAARYVKRMRSVVDADDAGRSKKRCGIQKMKTVAAKSGDHDGTGVRDRHAVLKAKEQAPTAASIRLARPAVGTGTTYRPGNARPTHLPVR